MGHNCTVTVIQCLPALSAFSLYSLVSGILVKIPRCKNRPTIAASTVVTCVLINPEKHEKWLSQSYVFACRLTRIQNSGNFVSIYYHINVFLRLSRV